MTNILQFQFYFHKILDKLSGFEPRISQICVSLISVVTTSSKTIKKKDKLKQQIV